MACLAAPDNTAFTIAFDNQDAGIPHNIAIFSGDPHSNPNAKVLFRGETFNGVAAGALPPGTYHFHCDVHPQQMQGTILIGRGRP